MSTTTVWIGDVHTANPDQPRAEAIAYQGERIVSVGPRAQVLADAGPDATVREVGDQAIVPGFIDAHHHVCISALYHGLIRLTPPDVHDIPSLQAKLANAARATPEGAWLVAMEWDEALLAERRPPTRQELDDAVGDRPLFALHQTCHRALANSRALALAGIDRNTADPPGGVIARGRNGHPNGLLIERGMSRVEALARGDLALRDAEGFHARIKAHYRAMVAVGITRVSDTAVPVDLLPLYRASMQRGDVLIPTLLCPVSATGYLEEPWDVLDVAVSGERDGLLEVGPVKLVFDGAPGCSMCLSLWQSLGGLMHTLALSLSSASLDPIRTALSIKPRYGLKIRSGVAIYQPESAKTVVGALTERGFGVATHAIGNAAIEVALGAYTATGARLHDASTPPRIEHGSFMDRALIQKVADVGASVVVQPAFMKTPMYANAANIPGMPFFALRWMLDAGINVAGSSDYPVYGFDPLEGIRSAVERRNISGRVIAPDQSITPSEALALYTRNAAAVCGALDVTGTLEVGKRADLVLLSGPLDLSDDTHVLSTVVGGDEVYSAPSTAPQ